MARISQYKSLGTKMGGYKTTLSKVQSMEYAKKHSDWKAGEEKSLYNEIGGTVSNILGIVKEKELSKRQDAKEQEFRDKYMRLDEPDRPKVPGLAPQEPEIIDVGDEFMPGPMENLDILDVQDIGDAPVGVDYSQAATAGQGATQYKKIIPKTNYRDIINKHTGAGALPMTGVHLAEAGGIKQEDFSVQNAMVDQWVKEDADNPLFNKKKLEELEAGDRNVARAREIEDEKKRMIAEKSNQNVQSAYQGPVDAKSLALEMADMEEAGLPKPTRPEVTDDFYGDMEQPAVDDVSVVDPMSFLKESETLPILYNSPVEEEISLAMKKRGVNVTPDMFNKMWTDITYAESKNQNIQQIQQGEKEGEGTGPAEGFAQYETSKPYFSVKKQKMVKGSGSFKVGLQRLKNIYKDVLKNKKEPEWIDEAMDKDNPRDLTEDQQRQLMMADLYMQKGSSESLAKSFKQNYYKDTWLDFHWKGHRVGGLSKEERELLRAQKGAYYDSSMAARK